MRIKQKEIKVIYIIIIKELDKNLFKKHQTYNIPKNIYYFFILFFVGIKNIIFK
jgi:hypothetical protein